MFSFSKSLVAAVALLAILPSSLAQTAPPATTSGTATADQRRISACQATIETTGFNNEENYLTSDTTSYSVRYTYDFAGQLYTRFIRLYSKAEVLSINLSL